MPHSQQITNADLRAYRQALDAHPTAHIARNAVSHAKMSKVLLSQERVDAVQKYSEAIA